MTNVELQRVGRGAVTGNRPMTGAMVPANDNAAKACPHCNGPVMGPPTKVYCSRSCKDQYRVAKRLDIQCKCEGCGGAFHPKRMDRTRFCSRECFFDTLSAEAGARRPSEDVALLSSLRFSECNHCAIEFLTRSSVAVYCSDTCRAEFERIRTRDAWRAKAEALANDNELKPARECGECGRAFTPKYGDKRSVYCSKVCSKRSARRVARKAARALLKSVTVERVNPTKVFDRDGWSCVQCGVSTPRELRGTYEPNAPELDHIMPLSKGGEHSYANTQCLCRHCNATKADSLPVAA